VSLVAERLRVVLEFSKNKERDLLLYQELIKYSNPGAIVKDMLFGVLPLPNVDNVTIKEE
jgi:hypothetical protein